MSGVVDLIQATVRIEQPLGDGSSTVGSGFVVSAHGPDGAPRSILVTANHVFARMTHDKATVGFREQDATGIWRFAPVSVRIRGADGEPLWTKHPTQDVATIELPAQARRPAVPIGELPGERALSVLRVQPGDEMMVLGYPRGFSANAAGFPILRAGRVASYPLSPADRYPTYMVDFNVFAGNSGGPVYTVVRRPGAADRAVVTGLLTQQLKVRGDRLAMGNVTQADYISETIGLMADVGPAEVSRADGAAAPTQDPLPASTHPAATPAERLRQAWRDLRQDVVILMRRTWIVVRDWVLDRLTADPRRAPSRTGAPHA